jgi:hypothetical protein
MIVLGSLLAFLLLGTNAVAQETANYSQESLAALFDYTNDLNYSSQILEEYVNKNISDSEAIQSLMAIYMMAGRTEANIARVEPPAKYADFHSYTLNAVEYFRLYLWNLAKFLETKYPDYGVEAQKYLNQSLDYRQKAIDESILVL